MKTDAGSAFPGRFLQRFSVKLRIDNPRIKWYIMKRTVDIGALGSCAAGACESCQVQKEAALSGNSRVPQGCLGVLGIHSI